MVAVWAAMSSWIHDEEAAGWWRTSPLRPWIHDEEEAEWKAGTATLPPDLTSSPSNSSYIYDAAVHVSIIHTHTALSFSCSCLLLLKNLHASIPCSEETELWRSVFSSWFCSWFVEKKIVFLEVQAEEVGHGGCGQILVWDFGECHCSISLPIPGAYFLEDHSEQINGGILGGAIQHDAPQLPPLRLVRAAVRVPEQRPGVDDQRRGRGDRDGVRGDLPRLRVQQEGEAPDARSGVGRRGGVRGRGARLHARPARPGTQAPRRPRHDRLLHLHVRLAPLHHEDGDQDEERGVHAVPAVVGGVPVRHVVVHLRLTRPRPLRHDPQRVWERPGRRAAHPVCRLPEQQGQRCCRRRQAAGRRRGDVRRRQEQQGRRRRRQRCQGVEEGRQDGQPGLARSIEQAAI